MRHYRTLGSYALRQSRPARQRGPHRQRISILAIVRLAVPALAVIALSGPGLPATALARAAAAASSPPPCTATVTSRHPADDTTVGIRVSTAPAAHIRVTAHFKGGSRTKTARAGQNGRQTISYKIGGATPGYRVRVNVYVSRGTRHATCSTWFTPRKVRRHPHRAAAWCTATASVYYAPYDENNVYVHSNQPYADATASADGYSWSYETNSSGYALIYLNGPPPGAEITVTVGAATCYTSD